MAYNNIFPMTYQPQQMYYPQNGQTQSGNGNLTWVQGIEAAKSYLVAPNTTVTLWDSEAQVIYLKSADQSGMPSLKILDYKIRDNTPQETVSGRQSEFATKVDVESIKRDIVVLNERVNSMMKKGEETDEQSFIQHDGR